MNPNQGKPQPSTSSSLSAKALEYYRMYSATDELPKYFCGTYDLSSVAKSTPIPSRDIPEIVIEECEATPASPTSSITSAKKLEWDSGADIGYANYDPNKSLQKSSSMPILKRNVHDTECRDDERISEEVENEAEAETELEVDAEETKKHKELMAFLRMKVGIPTAESTPLERSDLKKINSDPEIYSQTPRKSSIAPPKRLLNTTVFCYELPPTQVLQEPAFTSTPITTTTTTTQSPNKNLNETSFLDKTKYTNKYRQHKLKNLHVSPPISIECLSNIKKSDIQTQTTVLESESDHDCLSIGIQTSRRSSKQEIIYLFHPSVQYDDKTTSSGCSNPIEIVDDKIFSNCNSFEYLAGNSKTSQETNAVAGVKEGSKSSTSSTLQSNVSLKVSMEKSLKIMEKLIKSTKYDDKVKQMYIRKMARKIVQINPGSDQHSSDSSKIVPKIALKHDKDNDWSKSSGAKIGSDSISTKALTSGSNTSSTKEVLGDTSSSSTKAVKSVSDSSSTKAIRNESEEKQSWKNSLTLSEKLYSSVESTDSPKEAIVSFAKRERESQLNWINSEIEHLAKLKSLLESKKNHRRPTTHISTSVPNLPNYKKSTAVYMITTEKQSQGDCPDKECTSKTKKLANGRIDFHVHDNLGVRDYQFKEIITRISPETIPCTQCEGDCPTKHNPQKLSTHSCPHIPNPNPSHVSERPTCPAQCYNKCYCTPHPVTNPDRSRSSTPPDSSITDDTSGYPSRRRHHQPVAPTREKKGKVKARKTAHCHRRDCSSGAEDNTYLPGKCQDVCKAKDSDSESSHYESLTKYPTEPDSPPAGHQPPTKTPPGRSEYINVTAERQAIELNHASTSILSPSKKGVKSYKDYKAAKLKEKHMDKDRASYPVFHATDDHVVKRVRHSTAKPVHGPLVELPSENEPKSISEEEINYKEQERKRRSSKTRVGLAKNFLYEDRCTPREQEFHPGSIHNKLKQRSKPISLTRERTRTILDPTITEVSYQREKTHRVTPTENRRLSPTGYETGKSITPTKFKKLLPKESGDEPKRSATSAPETDLRPIKTKLGSKTDTEVPPIERERCTNTDVVWDSSEPEEVVHKNHGPSKIKERLVKCICVDRIGRKNSVSQQTHRIVQQSEKGVMIDTTRVKVDGKETQADEVKPLMKQKAVGDDTNRTRREIGSQIANGRVTEAGLSLMPAEVVTYLPSSGDNLAAGRPYKMVKELSQLNLNSAVVISSVVTSSSSNPDGHIRRLVLEVPLDDHQKDRVEKTKKLDVVDNAEIDLSLHSCFGTQSEDTTAGSTTDVMCSCCGKEVVVSENLMQGDKGVATIGMQGQYCWPCYCQNAKGNWNQQEQPYYQQQQQQQQPDMMCNCYNKIDENIALEKIRDTLRQLAEIDKVDEEQPQSTSIKSSERLVCNACNKKIKRDRDRDQPLKKPVAYVLKFEPGDIEEDDPDEKPSVHSLQEIRVKVPVNKFKKMRHKHKSNEKCDNESHKSKECENCEPVDPNLQDYLKTNRPDFVQSAEERRRCMIELAYMREQRCQRYKELIALSNGIQTQNQLYPTNLQQKPRPRLFSTKEMKRFTAKKYKKLPEVQQKLLDNRKKQVFKANRLLANIFNKKLQEMVLRGQASLSASISLINLM